MKALRALLAACLLVPPPVIADEDEALGHMLALVHALVRARGVDDLFAGRDPEANRAAAGLLREITAGMAPAHREKVYAIARDALGGSSALQARKDLAGMGLRYYDEQQFLDAIKRRDALAVELFIAGRGIDLEALAGLLSRSLPEAR